MLPDRVSNPGPLTYESGALPIALWLVNSRFSNSKLKFVVQMKFHIGIFYCFVCDLNGF